MGVKYSKKRLTGYPMGCLDHGLKLLFDNGDCSFYRVEDKNGVSVKGRRWVGYLSDR